MESDLIYLDYNATTPIAPEVADAMEPFLRGGFGNPSSGHRYGLEARQAITRARAQVAGLLGCAPDEIIFTSGGSESNNTAIIGTARALRERGRHIITSSIEHPAVTQVCQFLEEEGYRITWLPVDADGLVNPADLERALSDETILVTIMHANNETGTLQPIADLARIAHARGVRVHSDGAQSVGKVRTHMDELSADLFSVAGHKLYAPKGIGALYIRRGTELRKFIHGADHETNRRAGTENTLEIVGLGKACEIAARDLRKNQAHLQSMRDRLHTALAAATPDLRLNGHQEHRLPNTLSVSFPGLEANTILDELSHVAASAGAACHADQVEVSHVLEAMHVPIHEAMGTIRFSVGRETTPSEIDHAADEIIRVTTGLRSRPDADDATPITSGASEDVKLTHFTHGLGCACKIRPQTLEAILKKIPKIDDENLLVGTDSSDDAAVYQVTPDLAIVETLDFFTPIVDDPRAFGAIAAANALSDIYAMGARPLFALNIVGFPVRRLPLKVLEEILAGASDTAAAAGIHIVGGHSVEDPEPKFGWAVTGVVDPKRVLANSTAQPGDVLILTKPIGLGILATAAKRGVASPEAVAEGSRIMACLNRAAAEVMERHAVHACTDITGFGLIGHLHEMTSGSGVNAELWQEAVPVIDESRQWAEAGVVPGGTQNNAEHVEPYVDWGDRIAPVDRLLLCDAQTSGGLLISVAEAESAAMLQELLSAGVDQAAIVGRITGNGPGRIAVTSGSPR